MIRTTAPASAALAAAAALVAVAALAACGGDSPPPGDPDAPGQPTPDAPVATPDAAPCPAIDQCGWLTGYEQDIVGRLSGEREITTGVTLTARASVAQRATARTFLFDELTRLGYAPTLHQYATNGANVIATLPATSGSGGGMIIVGAHFDGVPVGPAAADNATGTAIVLAAARYLATVADRTHPITFAVFDQEEVGLVGSDAYAQALVDDATVVDAVHNFDMVSFDGDQDRAVELWSPSPELETAYRNVASPLGIPIQPVAFQYSDHQSFLDHGFVTVGVSEEFVANDHTPHYHLATDTYDKINFAYLAMVSSLGITVIETAATAPVN